MRRHAACVGHRGSDGFTLVEALVVLAVLAVLLMLAVPGLGAWRERQQLQAQVEDFYNSLMLARAQALLHQQHVSMCTARAGVCDPSAAWHAGWLVFVDANRNGQRETSERVLEQHGAIPGGVQIIGNRTVNRVIGYSAEGRSTNLTGGFLAGTVTACLPGHDQGWQVVINAVGRPKVEPLALASCP